jgi:hypothetical protein
VDELYVADIVLRRFDDAYSAIAAVHVVVDIPPPIVGVDFH